MFLSCDISDKLLDLFNIKGSGRPAPVYQRPPRQPGSLPYKPPVIPIRHGPPISQPVPNRYTPQQVAPSSNRPTYISPAVQGKKRLSLVFTSFGCYCIFQFM